MGWEVGRRFKRDRTYIYLWVIHAEVWQKPIQYCKAIILQLKIHFKKDLFFLELSESIGIMSTGLRVRPQLDPKSVTLANFTSVSLSFPICQVERMIIPAL